MSKNTEITKLRKELTKWLQPIVDEGSWNPRSKKHHVLLAKYDGCPLHFQFPLSAKGSVSMDAVYRQVRKELAKCGLVPPDKLKLKMITPGDFLLESHLEGLYDFIDRQEQLITAKGDWSDAKTYLKQAQNVQRRGVREVSQKKPYKLKISYDAVGGLVTYYRYYYWGQKMYRDGRYRIGFMSCTKDEYREQMIIWKEKNQKK